MNKLLSTLRGARKLEVFLAVAAAALLLLHLGDRYSSTGIETELERRLTKVLSQVENVGSLQVMVTEDESGRPEGVLIVAEGASDISVCLNLQYAVQTLLGVECSRIEIIQSG